MAAKKIGIVIALDGEKQFTQGVQNANKESAALKAELKNLKEEFDGNANSMEYLTKKQDVLTRQQTTYQQKLKAAQGGLEKANENLKDQTKRLAELESELGSASKKLSDMKAANEEGSDAYKEQEKIVNNLQDAVERQTFTRNKEIGSISDWTKKINVAETELKKNSREIDKNEQYIKEASQSFDKCAKSIDGYEKAVEKATPIILDRCSQILSHLLEPTELTLDGFEHKFYGILKKHTHSENVMRRWHTLTLEMECYEFGEEISQAFSKEKEFTVENSGNILTPAVIEITPQVGAASITLTGICRDANTGEDLPVAISELETGKTVTLDGETGLITQDGELKTDIEIWGLPTLLPGENKITVDNEWMDIAVRFRPRFM